MCVAYWPLAGRPMLEIRILGQFELRREGGVVHVEMFTLWDDLEAIRRFAGNELTAAKYYDFDPDFLLEMEPEVVHFEVIE